MKGIFLGFIMGNVSHETARLMAVKLFKITDDEYIDITDKFGLYICCRNLEDDAYEYSISRKYFDEYGVIEML